MKIGVIQPNYLPWRGYFDLIDDVDLFVFHDDIQYTKSDWRNRNKIKTSAGSIWMTVPVSYQKTNQLIKDTLIDYSLPWKKKHLNLLGEWYKKSTYFKKYRDELENIYEKNYSSISDLNIELIKWCMRILDINTPLLLSSEIGITGNKTERLIDLLIKLNATSYLSGPSAKNYLRDDLFLIHGITLEYKSYVYEDYPQLWGGFIGEVSVLDLIFNLGKDARKFLKSS